MNERGEVTGSVWPGKSDLYHAFQATLIPYCSPGLSVASAVCRQSRPKTGAGQEKEQSR